MWAELVGEYMGTLEEFVEGEHADTSVKRSCTAGEADDARRFSDDASKLHDKLRGEHTSLIKAHKSKEMQIPVENDEITNLKVAPELPQMNQFLAGMMRDMQKKAQDDASIDEVLVDPEEHHKSVGDKKRPLWQLKLELSSVVAKLKTKLTMAADEIDAKQVAYFCECTELKEKDFPGKAEFVEETTELETATKAKI